MARRGSSKKSKASRAATAFHFTDTLTAATLASTYLVHGREDYLRREVLLAIRRAAFGAEDSPSLAEFDAETTPIARILDEARTLPFLGGDRRVVIVTRAEALVTPPPDSWTKKRRLDRETEIEALFHYLARPVSTATLVLVAQQLDRRRKASKRLFDALTVVQCDAPGPELLRPWLERLAGDTPFAAGAADRLVDLCAGGQVALGVLAAEVAKLSAMAQSQGKISRAMVERLVNPSSADGMFDLVRPINAGQTGRALEMVGGMLRDGAVDRSGKRIRDATTLTTVVIGTLGWDLRKLWQAFSLLRAGRSSADIRAQLKTFGAGDFIKRAGRTDRAALAERHSALREADIGAKSSAPPLANLSRLIVRLATIAQDEQGTSKRNPRISARNN